MIRLFILIGCCLALSGCLGGTVAQQIARSIATSVADRAVGSAVEAQARQDALRNPTYHAVIQKSAEDPYRDFMLAGRFAEIKPIEEPLPDYPKQEQEIPMVILESNPLVKVELFNLLIGDEKLAVLEKARLQGALNLPEENEWQHWQVATGKVTSQSDLTDQVITFLIPPEFGKPASGSSAMVEVSHAGDINIARYKGY